MTSRPVTRLLASVRSVDEARVALANGADIIDLKEPADGALGCVPSEIARGVVACVDGAVPVSATIGDLPLEAARILPAVAAMSDCAVDYIKIGLFANGDAAGVWLRKVAAVATALHESAPKRVWPKLVAVLFADQAPNFTVIDVLAQHGFSGVMLDTADKANGSLLDHLSLEDLQHFVLTARRARLLTGLAGSLRSEHVPKLLPLDADYLGFRGALCDAHDRVATLSAARVQQLRALLTACPARVALEA